MHKWQYVRSEQCVKCQKYEDNVAIMSCGQDLLVQGVSLTGCQEIYQKGAVPKQHAGTFRADRWAVRSMEKQSWW